MAISKEKKMKSLHQYARHEGDTGSVEVKLLSLLGKSTTLTTTSNNTKRPRYYRGFDEKSVTVVTCWHTFAAQTLTVTVS